MQCNVMYTRLMIQSAALCKNEIASNAWRFEAGYETVTLTYQLFYHGVDH